MTIERLSIFADYLRKCLSISQEETVFAFDELTIVVSVERIIEILLFLRDDEACRFACLVDVSGVDYPARERRFEINYHLLSPYKNMRVRVKIMTDEVSATPSVCSIYAGAEWYEREIYDMYGVRFFGHQDLRRILTDYGFEGHPLRKDFPTSGFVECRYDDASRRIVYEPIILQQEMRNFDFLSPWKGEGFSPFNHEKARE